MPKVVSRTTVSTGKSETTPIQSYFCVCGQLVLLLDAHLSSLPIRRTDHARVINGALHSFKTSNTAKETRSVLLRRTGGLERQERVLCGRCSLPLFYRACVEDVDAQRRQQQEQKKGDSAPAAAATLAEEDEPREEVDLSQLVYVLSGSVTDVKRLAVPVPHSIISGSNNTKTSAMDHGKTATTTVATSLEEDEQQLEDQEYESSYAANVKVIEELQKRQKTTI